MADTTTVTIPLEVVGKFQALVKESLGGESVYIRAKETLQQMFADSEINSTDKAAALGTIIGSMVNGITSSSMATALEWAKYEKELALKKLEMDQQLLILAKEALIKDAQLDQIETQNRLALVESKRMFGTGTFDVATGALINLTEEGKVWNDMALVTQQTTNASVEETLLGSKIKESTVAIHKVVADTFVNFGAYTFTYDPSGNGINSVTQKHLESHTTLSDTQQDIAIEQGKGYTYNAWANALTGSASILGTALASGDFNFQDDSGGRHLLETVVNCATNLKNTTSNSEGAIPTSNFTIQRTVNNPTWENPTEVNP